MRICLASGLLAMLLCSCASDTRPSGPGAMRWKDRAPLERDYKPITGHSLFLLPVTSRRSFFAGEDVELSFQLINRGERPISIFEWFQDHDANLLVYYRPYSEEVKEFIASEWSCLGHTPKSPAHRFQMVLKPDNSAILSKPLDFIREMQSPETTKKFMLVGQLNLKSLPLRSQVMIIEVK